MRKILLLLLLLLSVRPLSAQEKGSAVRVFIDCTTDCDFTYIRTEINFVSFVPDPYSANVFIQITGQATGSGGEEVKLFFTGRESFAGLNDTLTFSRSPIATEDEYRILMVRYLQLGLARYLARTPAAGRLSVAAEGDQALNNTTTLKDPWDYWVMRVFVNGNFNSNDFNKFYRYTTGLEAQRTTEKVKYNAGLNYRKNVQEVRVNGVTSTYPNVNYYGYLAAAPSISDHFSYGGSLIYEYSTFSNYASQVRFAPGIEYSFFPYREAVKRAVTVYYEVGPSFNRYIDTSYYETLKERIVFQQLSMNADFIQSWGNVSFSASWQSFLNKFNLDGKTLAPLSVNNLSVGGDAEIRLFKGLFFNFYAGADFTKGVFPNLRKSDFDAEDIITGVRQVPTTNNIFVSFGVNYRFGSIYNNVVNPRFRRSRFF